MTDIHTQELAGRYIALWNEPDAGMRRKAIEEVWAADGTHVLQPPQEIREIAAGLGFDSTTLEAHGYDEIEVRVMRSYEKFVAPGEFLFRPRGDALRLHDVVKFTWEMVPVGGDGAVGGGLEVLVLGEGDRVIADYMFPGL
ncbi:hypothetical protein [Planotetraspora kaengkrachanensis]|uniref:SnoaL-like domain-containing protein n=1 Tax=Planotetraspora kaengkrachanensis TaxID=575193 RepID=A0A8J3PWZ3_9ACTN|nr:hypothetical protein [Planotetraspora kaengkrachanensis]GIG82507.1 hypothetical protein Pka01_56340 [Planotetraspora kaengkrachanensis]